MWHYFTELLVYIFLTYIAGCVLGAAWRKMFARTSVPETTAPFEATPAVQKVMAPEASATPLPVATPVLSRGVERAPVAENLPDDNLLRIKGVGPNNLGKLNAMGITRYEQIANWTDSDISRVERELEFDGRINQEEWTRQARLLANGQDAEFNRIYGSGPAKTTYETDRTFRVQGRVKGQVPDRAQGQVPDRVQDRAQGQVQGASTPSPAKVSHESRESDDLLVIRGIGPKNNSALRAMGITRFEQIANWTDADIERVERELEFDGRIEREEWIKQARLLAGGKNEEYASLYGNETKRTGSLSKPKGISGPRNGKPDNLKRLSGVGPKYEKTLHSLGFFHFDQIAEWTDQQVEWVDNHLNFNGRIQREEWIRQAKLLADGDEKKFEKEFGTGGLKNAQGETQSGSRTRKN